MRRYRILSAKKNDTTFSYLSHSYSSAQRFYIMLPKGAARRDDGKKGRRDRMGIISTWRN